MANFTHRAALLLLAAATSAGSGLAFAQTTAVKPDPPPIVCIGSNCVSAPASAAASGSGTGGTTGTSTGTGIKWHPGAYLDSQVFTSVGNLNTANKAAEIAFLHTNPAAVKGYEAYYFWPVFENNSQGVYDFSALDADYVKATGYVSGKTTGAVYTDPRRFAIYMLQTDYFDANPLDRCLPAYIGASSAYGPVGPDGTHYGYWTATGSGGTGTGSVIAFWRASVMNRYIALFKAMATHVLPDGYTVDTSPYVEWVKTHLETADTPQGSNDSTFSSGAYVAQLQALNSAMAAAFPHTTYVTPANYTGPTGNEDVTLVNSLTAVRSAVGGPDVFGASSGTNVPTSGGLAGLTFGQAAYIGLKPPSSSVNPFFNAWSSGGTDHRGSFPYVATIQCTEMVSACGIHYTPSDLFQQANGTLKATHIAWSYIVAGQYSGLTTDSVWLGSASSISNWSASSSGGVLAQIVNAPVTNTSCPSSYTAGCNTQ